MFGFIDKKTIWVVASFVGVAILLFISIQISDEVVRTSSENRQMKNVMAYTQYNEALTTESPTLSALEVIRENQGIIDKLSFTKMIYSYENLLVSEKSNFSNRVLNPSNSEELYSVFSQAYSSDQIDEVKNKNLKENLIQVVNSGYKLCRSEVGMYKICLDYRFFEQFESNLTKEARLYFRIMEKEEWTLGESAVDVTPLDRSKRLAELNDFILKYPKSARRESINTRANMYLLSLLFGYGNVMPYSQDTQEVLPIYKEAYTYLADHSHGAVKDIFTGLLSALETSNDIWTESVFDYVYEYPEIFRKEYLGISLYEDAFIDVVYGRFADGTYYYYPAITGIDSSAELGKVNGMLRGVIEKYMLGKGFKGMYSTNSYMWSGSKLTFHRQNIISLKYSIYIEKYDGSSYWKYEGFNYDFVKKRQIQLTDILKNPEDRQKINTYVEGFLSKSRTYYAVSLEDFYKNTHPDFYIGDYGITLLIPQDTSAETFERNVGIFVPFEIFSTNVEHIYKIPIE